MRRGAKSALIGKWRIIEMELWDSDYLDMVEPDYIQFQANELGEFKFGCVISGLDCTLFAAAADFTWQGSDEMDPVSGDGWAELDDDGTINGEISFHLGDESPSKLANGDFFSSLLERNRDRSETISLACDADCLRVACERRRNDAIQAQATVS